MRFRIFFMLVTILFLVSCSGIKERGRTGSDGRRVEISFSFNPVHYPWLLGKKYPQIAVWVKSESNHYETVFVTRGSGKNDWYFADERPDSLPVWFGVRKQEADANLDAVTGATPGGNSHTIVWRVPESHRDKDVTIFLEANVSYDYNDFYRKDAGPGFSGVNGQPSIIWSASFKIDGNPKEMKPEIVGHGHVLGENGAIDPDISHITTALALFNHINITYDPGS